MGQNHSTSGKDVDVSMLPEDIQKDHQKVIALRKKLALLKAEGKVNRKKRKKEIKRLEKRKVELHVTLMKLGKHAQRHFSFWDYVRIIRSTFQTVTKAKTLQGSNITLQKQNSGLSNASKATTSSALVRQSDAVQYTIFAFYEAYLLKKLHVAMMLKTQKKLHAKGWNDMVMYLYAEIPKIQASFEKGKTKVMNQQQEKEGQVLHVEELYKAHVENQNKLMVALQEAVEGKVRKLPEGQQFSFRKKTSPLEPDDSSSSPSEEFSVSSSRSFGKKEVRPSMMGHAYESGSSKEMAYQAPWMKSSRNKLKKVTSQTARNRSLEEGEEAPNIFKEEVAIKEEEEEEPPKEEPKEEPVMEEPPKAEPTEEEPKEEPKEEPVAEEPPQEEPEEEPAVTEEEPPKEEPKVEETAVTEEEPPKEEPTEEEEPSEELEVNAAATVADKRTSERTEPTAKSSEAGDEEEPVAVKKKKKKKKNRLPKGMPETLEIISSDDEFMDLEGEEVSAELTTGIKKKKKKKKKKVGATTTDSEDESLFGTDDEETLGGEEPSSEFGTKKKKKKKKKKGGADDASWIKKGAAAKSDDEDVLDGEPVVVKKKKKKKKAGVSSDASVVSELSMGTAH